MDEAKVATVMEWPILRMVKDGQVWPEQWHFQFFLSEISKVSNS